MALIYKILLHFATILRRKFYKPSCKQRRSVTTFAGQTVDSDSLRLQYIREALNCMMQKLTFYDVTLVCGAGHYFHGNRKLLSAFSRFFECALCKGWKETSSSRVELPLISPTSMSAILSYICYRKLPEMMYEKDDMIRFLYDSDYLQMDELVEHGFKEISELHLTPANFIDLTRCTEQLGNSRCFLDMVDYLAKNFCEITKSVDFFLLNASLLKEIIRHPNMDRVNMDQVLRALLKWSEADSRQLTFLNGFLKVLQNWCPECLRDLIKCNIMHKKWSFEILNLLSLYHDSFLRDKSRKKTLACFMENEIEKNHILGIIDAENFTWLAKSQMPANYRVGVVGYDQHLYLFGGNPGPNGCIKTSSTFVKYCPLRNVVLMKSESLIFPVYRAGVGVFNESIYIVNGLNDDRKCVKTVQCYNPRTNRFHLVSPTNCGHLNPLVFSFSNALHIIGSITHDSNFMERYDSLCNQWTILTEIPTFCYQCSATVCDTQLYVLNHVGERHFHVYDLKSETWSVSEFQGGPQRTVGLVTNDSLSDSKIIAVDVNGILHKFDMKTGWTADSAREHKLPKLYVLNVIFLGI